MHIDSFVIHHQTTLLLRQTLSIRLLILELIQVLPVAILVSTLFGYVDPKQRSRQNTIRPRLAEFNDTVIHDGAHRLPTILPLSWVAINAISHLFTDCGNCYFKA